MYTSCLLMQYYFQFWHVECLVGHLMPVSMYVVMCFASSLEVVLETACIDTKSKTLLPTYTTPLMNANGAEVIKDEL